MRISGCVIARNEQDNIVKFINSLNQVVDEIIVVDTGSEDNTVQTAKSMGAAVYEQEWKNDFSHAKNAALDHAKGDWIIFPDADEYFSSDTLAKVRAVIERVDHDQKIDGIICDIVNIDKDSGQVISKEAVLRIFRNNKAFRFINKIHEEVRNGGAELNCEFVGAELTIFHTGYSASLLQSKTERNLQMLLENADDEKATYYLAVSYNILGDHENALKYALLALADDNIARREHLVYKMHLIKIFALTALKYYKSNQIREAVDAANERFGKYPEIARAEANYLFSDKQFNKALEKYLYSLECQAKYGNELLHNEFHSVIHEVYYNAANLFFLMNRETVALEYYVKALTAKKHYAEAFGRLLLLFKTVSDNEVIFFLNSLYNVESEADVKFLVSQIADCGRPGLVVYYVDKWNNVFGHEDDSLIYAYISLGKYQNALEIVKLYLKENKEFQYLAAAIIIISRLFGEADSIKKFIDADCVELISSCARGRKYSASKETYLSVLMKLIRFQEQYDVAAYLEIGDFGSDSELTIAEIFMSNFQFDQAAISLQQLYETQVYEDMRAATALKIGFCLYKLKEFDSSLFWFEKAADNGYSQIDLAEYLQWIIDQSPDEVTKAKAGSALNAYRLMKETSRNRLHLGCGRDIKDGWINLDLAELPGIDVVADLDDCRRTPLPFDDDTFDEMLASHVIEHIRDPLPMMQELHRIAKPNAKAIFKCPYGTSDDAFEDPTHVKQYLLDSFGAFSQPFYWNKEHDYQGDWLTDRVTLVVDRNKYKNNSKSEILEDVLNYRNTVIEMITELHAVKPPREAKQELTAQPDIEIQFI